MALNLSDSTFTNLGSSVAGIFAGFGAKTQASLTAQGLNIQAYGTLTQSQLQAAGLNITAAGTLITAEGTSISAAGVTQQAAGLRIKAGGDLAEATQYDLAAAFARKNEDYVRESTAIQSMQLDREIAGTMGTARATAGGSGLEDGSVVDILADSAAQGSIAHSVLQKQEAISVAGYEEQAQSYDVMSAAARMAYGGEMSIADATDAIAARTEALSVQQKGIATQQQGLAAQTAQVGSIVAGQQQSIAAQTAAAGDTAATGDWIGSAIKGVSAVAGLFL